MAIWSLSTRSSRTPLAPTSDFAEIRDGLSMYTEVPVVGQAGVTMAIVPKAFSKRITFYESRVALIEANAATLGLSAQEVADFKAQVDAARTAYQHQYALKSAARSATSAMHEAVKTLNRNGMSIIERVRLTARLENDPLVLNLAHVPPIAKKSPIGTPGTPFDFKTKLDGIGNLKLIWKCEHPRGARQTIYHVWRRIGFNGPREYVGFVGTKYLVDRTIPAGVTQLLYEIQAVRSTCEGQVANFNVSFGSNRADMPSPIVQSIRGTRVA